MDWPTPTIGPRRKFSHCSDLDTDGKRRRGRPRETWQRTVKGKGLSWVGTNGLRQSTELATDRGGCSTWHEGDS